jgi:hypothetical protein
MKRFTMRLGIAIVSVGVVPPVFASLSTFIFEVSNTISPDHPSATVTLRAVFGPEWYAFNETRTEVMTEFDRGWFSDPVAILDPWKFSKPGDVSPDGNRVSDIYIMQLYVPFSIYPSAGSPISLWSATWTTDIFTPRQVDLGTASESFWVYDEDGGYYDQFGIDFAEGSGVINVIPAPGGAALLVGAGALAARRRRPQARWPAP